MLGLAGLGTSTQLKLRMYRGPLPHGRGSVKAIPTRGFRRVVNRGYFRRKAMSV